MNTNFMKVAATLILGLLAAVASFGQGKIAGKVVDKTTGETVIGANITVEGANTGGVTDLDGNYFITVPAGTYKLKIEYLGYTSEEISGVEVKDKETTYTNAVIAEAAEQLNEVVVQAEAKRETVNALLIQQKNSVAMVTGISAEQFRRLPDKSTSDVLKRISGASIQENKFAIIRGLNDRYNMAMLNGVPMPSTESDRKAFAFDLIPANLLDNLMISKTATPDMPGDFAGGIIQINTKDIPEENTFFVNVGGSTHSLTTFKEYYKSPSPNTNTLVGNPETKEGELISAQESQTATTNVLVAQTKLFDNNFEPRKSLSAAPNYSLQGGFSKRLNLAGNPLGILFSTTYGKNFRYTPFSNNNPLLGDAKSYDETQSDGDFLKINNYKTTVNSGTILNLSYRIGLNNKISLKNLYTFNADDQSIFRNGVKYTNGRQESTATNDYSYLYQASKMFASQLNGESVFGESKIKLKYNAGYTTIERDIPDYKRILYESTKLLGSTEALPYIATIASDNPLASGRFTSKLNEKVYSGSYTLNIPFVFVVKNEIKVGGFHQWRDRSVIARNFAFDKNENTFESQLLEEKPDVIFSDKNLSKNGFYQVERTPSENKYDASSTLHAGFVMLDNKFSEKFRLIWGVRLESFNQKVMSKIAADPLVIDKTWNDLLPSANFIYSINEKSNARFSYSKTLSRPEFREFAPMSFLDFNLNAVIRGNPELTRATVQNIDLKYEIFLGEGQVISATPFFKHFTNPVEANVDALGGVRNFNFVNVKSARNYGIELEWRTSLKPIDKLIGAKIFENFTFYTNYALIKSTVDLKGTNANFLGSRPLQGQSPYVLNGGIQYSNVEKGLDLTLAVNRIGRRIAFIANESKFLIYENSRTVLDFSVSKKFFKKFTARLVFGDLLAKSQPLIFYQDINGNEKYDKGTDVESFKYMFGWTSNFSLGYTF